jgi:hypothetical protein
MTPEKGEGWRAEALSRWGMMSGWRWRRHEV